MLVGSLGERVDGKWSAPDVGLLVPRQNGKGSILEARELAGLFLFDEEVIIHSAHEQATASEQFRRLLSLIEGVPEFDRRVFKAPKGKGNEAIELRGGQRIFFKTRTGGGGRGFTCDCLIYDEAMILPEAFVSATSPTLAARSLLSRTGVQTWYTGSAVDQQSNEHGVSFARIREQGHKGDPGLAYFEWSAEGDDPGRVDPKKLREMARVAEANPGLGIRISAEYVERELVKLGSRGFAVERMSIGDWPDTSDENSRIISLEAWNALTDLRSSMAGRGVLTLDVTPESSAATIGGAGKRADGLLHVGVVDRDAGTSWVPGRLGELNRQLRPVMVVADPSGAVSPLIPAIEREGVKLTLTTAKDFAQACGMLANGVRDATLRHRGEPELAAAVIDCSTKPLGEGWKWDRRNSAADISPLVAISLAVWGIEAHSRLKPRVVSLAAALADDS